MLTCLKIFPLTCLVGIAPMLAHAGDEELTCREGGFSAQAATFLEARVVGSGPLHFRSDTDGCPGEAKTCIQRAYVLPGDRLIVGRRHRDYRCVLHPDGDGTAGWVPEQRLDLSDPGAAPALEDWQGHWRDGDNTLGFIVAGAMLAVEGDAYWPANLPPEDLPNGPNLGSIEARATPSGRDVRFAEGSESYRCHLHAVLAGRFLLVDDNGQCGGMNVRFDGIYQRDQTSARP